MIVDRHRKFAKVVSEQADTAKDVRVRFEQFFRETCAAMGTIPTEEQVTKAVRTLTKQLLSVRRGIRMTK